MLTAIEGTKVSGGLFGGVIEHKLSLRFDEAHGPLLMAFQTGKTEKDIHKVLDIFYNKADSWEKPKKSDRTA